jgi:hypothetical protein
LEYKHERRSVICAFDMEELAMNVSYLDYNTGCEISALEA